MTYEEADELIRDHIDYGGSVDVHALAVAISAHPTLMVMRTCPRPCRYAHSPDYTPIGAPVALSTESVDKGVDRLTEQEILRIASQHLEMGDLLRSMRTDHIYGEVQIVPFARALLAASDSQGGAA